MGEMCAHCNLNTAGMHAWNCPMNEQPVAWNITPFTMPIEPCPNCATLTARLLASEAERDELEGVVRTGTDAILRQVETVEDYRDRMLTAEAERDSLRQRCAALEGALEKIIDKLNRPAPLRLVWAKDVQMIALRALARPATPTEAEG